MIVFTAFEYKYDLCYNLSVTAGFNTLTHKEPTNIIDKDNTYKLIHFIEKRQETTKHDFVNHDRAETNSSFLLFFFTRLKLPFLCLHVVYDLNTCKVIGL